MFWNEPTAGTTVGVGGAVTGPVDEDEVEVERDDEEVLGGVVMVEGNETVDVVDVDTGGGVV
jgi:hypothetical protein